jgi:mannosylglycerate hydrolase
MPPLRTVIVVSHTHWDREWYLPFEDFRWQLVKTVDQLIELMEQNPQYKHFNLDGQTIVIDDYLELRPTNKDRLKNLVTSNRFQIGPWYVLADEFLVSGEALVRNLLYGHQTANHFGNIMPIGYVPDAFGHIAQLPQILKGFDIDASVWWRGFEDGGKSLPTELRWRAPDGSEVLLVHLRTSYSTAANLPDSVDAALAQLLMPMNLLALNATSSAILLMNGSDHLPPQPFLPDLLDAINRRLKKPDILQGRSISQLIGELGKSPTTTEISGVEEMSPFLDDMFSSFIKELQGVTFKHGTLEDYINIIRKEVDVNQLLIIEGEQHSSKYIPILPGVFSARMYLKQANFATQQLLERWVEPFATIAWWHDAPYPTEGLRRAWQLLLKNHPHDSICGCSVDETHADMERRFAWSQQIGNQILSEAIVHINDQADALPHSSIPKPSYASFRVYNPHPWSHSDIVRIRLQPSSPLNSNENLVLYDSSGKKVPFQMASNLDQSECFNHFLPIHTLPDPYAGEPQSFDPAQQIQLTFVAPEIPALGYQTFFLAPDNPKSDIHDIPPITITAKKNSYIIENPMVRLVVYTSDGELDLLHKPTKKHYARLLTLEDGGDVGDEYNYCPPQADTRITSHDDPKTTIRFIEEGPLVVTLEVTTHLSLPTKANICRKRRSENSTPYPVQHLITLYPTHSRIDISTTLDNTVSDHRLRVLFPTSIETDTAWGDTPFHVTERPLTPAPHTWDNQLYPMMMDFYLTSILKYPNIPEKPMGWFEDSTTTHAMQNFVDVTDSTQGLLVATRGLPEYEVLNDTNCTIALTLLRSVGWLSREDLTTRRGHAGPKLATPGAQCPGRHTFHYSLIPHPNTWRDPELQRLTRAFITPFKALQIKEPEKKNQKLPAKHSFLSFDSANLVLSCLKKAEDSETTILRFFEITGSPTKANLQTSLPFKNVTSVNLAEQHVNQQQITQKNTHIFTTNVNPYQIHSLQLDLSNQP